MSGAFASTSTRSSKRKSDLVQETFQNTHMECGLSRPGRKQGGDDALLLHRARRRTQRCGALHAELRALRVLVNATSPGVLAHGEVRCPSWNRSEHSATV